MKTACLFFVAASLALLSLAYASPTELTESPEPFAEDAPAPAAEPHPDALTNEEAVETEPTLHTMAADTCLEMTTDAKLDACLLQQMECEEMKTKVLSDKCLSALVCASTPKARRTKCMRSMMALGNTTATKFTTMGSAVAA